MIRKCENVAVRPGVTKKTHGFWTHRMREVEDLTITPRFVDQ